MNGLSVCISSVVDREEGFRDYRFIAKCAASELGYSVIRNPEDAGMEQRSFEEYLKKKSPIVLLLVGSQDSEMVKKECLIAIDNCLPLMIFIKNDNDGITDSVKQFIKNISQISFEKDCVCFNGCEDLYNQVKSRLENYLEHKSEAYPIMEAYIGRAYRYSVDMFDHAKKRVILYQKTSSLILGPKYGNTVEQQFNKNMYSWIERMDENMEFLHIFSHTQTKKALKEEKYNITQAKSKLKYIIDLPNIKDNPKFVVRELHSKIDFSFFICDCETLLIFPIDKDRYTITIPPYIMNNTEISKIASELNNVGTNIKTHNILSIYD